MNEDKSILIVGNGYPIKNSDLGSKIDQFDEIIRINDWKTLGFEEDAGTKTTVWATYNPEKGHRNFIESYNKLGYNIKDIHNIVKDINEIWYVSWNAQNILQDWKKDSYLRDLEIYDKPKRHISMQYSKKIRKDIALPTTGFILIYILSHMYDKIYLAGFDFAGALSGKPCLYHHYYGEKLSKNVIERDIHNPKEELLYVEKLILDNKIEYLTKRTSIKKANFIGELGFIGVCKNCNKPYALYEWEQRICSYCESNI